MYYLVLAIGISGMLSGDIKVNTLEFSSKDNCEVAAKKLSTDKEGKKIENIYAECFKR